MKKNCFSSFLQGLLLFLVIGCCFESCSVISVVQTASPTADCAGSGQNFCHDTTICTTIWKGKNKRIVESHCNNGISRVKVTTRPLDVVVGFLTAGFVVKQHIGWDCAQRSGSSDIEP